MVLQQKGQLIDALKSLNKTKSAIRGNKRASSVSKCCMCCTQAYISVDTSQVSMHCKTILLMVHKLRTTILQKQHNMMSLIALTGRVRNQH